MTAIIITLLVIWLVLATLGAILKGLFWLTVVAMVLLIGTAVHGGPKARATGTG